MATQSRRLRADDLRYISLVDPAVSGYELVNGELVPIMPANPHRAELIVEISALLHSFVKARQLGRVFADPWIRLELERDAERVRAPDVAFVSNAKLQQSGGVPDDYFRVVPDLVIEIHSPTNRRERHDFPQRIRDYVDAGVPLLWVIYPEARYAIAVHADGSARLLREHERLDGENILPDFWLPLQQLFALLD